MAAECGALCQNDTLLNRSHRRPPSLSSPRFPPPFTKTSPSLLDIRAHKLRLSLSLFLFQYLFVSLPLDPLLALIHLPSFACDTTIYADTEFLTSIPSYPCSIVFAPSLPCLALSSNANPFFQLPSELSTSGADSSPFLPHRG